MTYFLKKKKWMAWVVLLTFLFTSFMPSNLLAGNSVASAEETTQKYTAGQEEQKEKQIDSMYYLYGPDGKLADAQQNSKIYYDKDGNIVGDADSIDTDGVYVSTSKTIAPTGVENEFDIELKVITKENVEVLETLKKEAAVVLVMDTSKSMQWDASGGGYCVECGEYVADADDGRHLDSKNGDGIYAGKAVGEDNSPMRITTAVNAATSFVDNFASSFSDKAMFSLVTFNVRAQAVKVNKDYWVDLANTGNVADAKKEIETLDNYDSTKSKDERTTKLHSGTNIAGGLQVAVKLLENLQDAPKNRYVILLTDGDPNRGICGSEDGYKVEGIKDGVDWKDSANTAAKKVKEKATIYTVGFSEDVSDANFMKGLATSFDKYSYAATSGDLEAEFEKITESITLLANAWQVLDPMGNNIQFLGFYDTNGTLKPSLSNGNNEVYCKTKTENEVDIIDWDLKKTGAAHKDGAYEYTLNYKVRLDTTATDFKSGEFQDTNGRTTLKYIVKKQNATGNDADSYEGPYTVDFRIPKVKGYLAGTKGTGIQFLKTAEDGKTPLPGATFTLQLSEDNLEHKHDSDCKYVEGDEQTSSGEEKNLGTFSFKDIPSGHTYTLTEDEPPTGYKTGGPWAVEVNYGVVTVKDKTGSPVNPNTGGVITIANHPNTGSIEFTKVDDQNQPLAGATFGLYEDEACLKAVVDATSKTIGDVAKVTFADLQGGTYYVKEIADKETPGYVTINGKTYQVDQNVYLATVTAGATTLALSKKVDGQWEKLPSVSSITNQKAVGNITFTKVKAEGNMPIAGATFGLYTKVDGNYVAYPNAAEPLTAPSNEKGTVIFKNIPYGTYYVHEESATDDYLLNPIYYEVVVNAATNQVNEGSVPNIEKTSVTVKKVWSDRNDQDGIRPETVKVMLYAEAEGLTRDTFADTLLLQPISPIGSPTKIAVKGITLSKDFSWEVTESNLPKTTLAGQLITYSVEEIDKPDGYNATYEKNNEVLVITNTHTPATTDLTVKKAWVGGDSGNSSISFKLFKQVGEKNEQVGNTYTITKVTDPTADTWGSVTISNLPVYEHGQAITYTVQEVTDGLMKPVNSDYTVSYSSPYTAATMKDGVVSIANSGEITITNTLTGKADVTVNKVWHDGENQDGKRADITVQLQSKVGDGTWTKVESLPQYNEQAQDAEQTLATNAKGSTNHDQNLTYIWHDVPLYDTNGNAISYRVVEIKIGSETVSEENKTADYTVTYSNNSGITPSTTERTVTITNTHTPETVKLQVKKAWVGDKTDNMDLTFNRPAKLIFTITGKVGETEVSSDIVEMTIDDNKNSQTIDVKKKVGETLVDLPKYSQGRLITYTIIETTPDGYAVSYEDNSQSWTWQPSVLATLFSGNAANSVDHVFKVTNILKTDGAFEFTKLYNGNQARGSSAQFTVKAVAPSGNGIADKKISGQNDVYTINDLKYGVIYEVKETSVPTGYMEAAPFYLKYVKNGDDYVVKAYHTYANGALSNEVGTLTTQNPTVDTGLYLNGADYKLMNFVKTADFSFTKRFDNGAIFDGSEMPTFNVTDTRGESVTVTLDDGRKEILTNVKPNAEKQYIFNNLEYGAYQVTENPFNGYEPVSFWITVGDDASGKPVAKVVANSGSILPVADANGHYTLTNIAKTTSLTLSKTYNGIETGHATFTITEEDEENPMADIGLKDGLYTFSGLQYGKTYTVVENAPLGYVGVEFTIDVTKTDDNGDPIAEINDKVDGLIEGSQSAGYDYALENKVKTTGFSFNKVFEENRNTTTPSFLAIELSNDGNETDNKVNFTYTSKGAGETITHQYSTASDALQYGKKYKIVETNTPAGYKTATPFEITIDLDENNNAVAKVTNFGEDFENGVLTNYLKAAEYEIHYHYQQLEETAQADYLGKYAYKEEGTVKTVSAKVGDQINFNNLTNDDKDSSKHVTTSSVYVFNAEKTETDNQNKIVVENVDGAKTVLNVYFDLRFAVQYHWKDADEQIHDDNTINEPKYDLTLNDVVNLSDNKAPNTDATPDNPWYLFNGQWYATTQQAFDWNFDNAQQWLLEEDQVDKENILTYVKDNVLHLYAAWNAKPAAAGNINVSKTVKVVNEKEGNTDRDKLFDFALDLYVTTGSGLTFEQAKANTTSPSAIDFKVTITDKDGKTLERAATLKDDGNGHYQYLFQLKDGENASFDLKAVASTGSALIWFQLDETSAGEDVGFTTELTGEESAVSGLSGIGCVDENGVYTFGYVNTFTYEADKPTDPEDPTDPERPRDPSDPREPDVDIEDPDVPLAEPDEPPIEIEDPDVPLTDVPGDLVEIDEPEVPLGDAPRTGDSSNAIPFVVLMMVGITGLAITRRKFN